MTCSAVERCVELRWPHGVRCPFCGACDVSGGDGPNPRWRCGPCARFFRVTTRTAMQGSKLSAENWARAACARDDSPGRIRELIGCSYPTARRVSAVLQSTERPAGLLRLKELLTRPPGAGRRQRPPPAPGLSKAEQTILGVLRALPDGGTTGRIAEAGFLSPQHVRRCLKALADRRWVKCSTARMRRGHGHADAAIWELTAGPGWEAASRLPWRPLPVDRAPDKIPHEFWWQFWSGDAAHLLSLSNPDSALRAAGTLIAGPDVVARQWALLHTPIETLRLLRTMRGYDSGDIAHSIDVSIRHREDQMELL